MLVAIGFFTLSESSSAEITIRGDGNFQSAVYGCFERFRKTGDGAAGVLEQLEQAFPKSHLHIIQRQTRPIPYPNTENAVNDSDAQRRPSGERGPGSNTVVNWNPNNTAALEPGVPRDPCASLLHELRHAADDDRGDWDKSGRSPEGVPVTEVRASTEENKYRDQQTPKLPQRHNWGRLPLPTEAIAPFIPAVPIIAPFIPQAPTVAPQPVQQN